MNEQSQMNINSFRGFQIHFFTSHLFAFHFAITSSTLRRVCFFSFHFICRYKIKIDSVHV